MQWLNTQQADYVLSGSIEEWRYKAGLDGEPVVALTLLLTKNGETTATPAPNKNLRPKLRRPAPRRY